MKTVKPLPLLLLLALPAVVQAQFDYTINNGTVTITQYTGSGGIVVIPSMTNGLPVTSIGDMAFRGQSSVTSVIILNSVTSIGRSVFQNCTNLTNVTISTNLVSIGMSAFENCIQLTSVIIPNGVTTIAINTFATLHQPYEHSARQRRSQHWSKCIQTMLRPSAFIVNAGNTTFSSLGGVLFNQSQTMLIEYPLGGSGNYTVPNSVTSIGENAFQECRSITNVMIN